MSNLGIEVTSVVAAPSTIAAINKPGAVAMGDVDGAARDVNIAARVLVGSTASLTMVAGNILHTRDVWVFIDAMIVAALGLPLLFLTRRMRYGRSPRAAAALSQNVGARRIGLLLIVAAGLGYLAYQHLPAHVWNQVNAAVPASLRRGVRDPARAESVRKQAEALGQAMIKGDYAAVIDNTYIGVVNLMGGREKAIETTATALKKMADDGITMQTYTVGTPGNFPRPKAPLCSSWFPVELYLVAPEKKAYVTNHSYLLAISADSGATWAFADGSDVQLRDKVLPKLPADLKLPAPEKPQVSKDD